MYAIVDIETTGGYAEYHRITEVAVVLHDGIRIQDEYRTLVNPGRNIPSFITGLTGITHEMVSEAPAFEEIAQELFQLLDGKVFVAHNAHFDYSFLKKEFEMSGIRWQSKKLCTVRLSRKLIPGLRSYSLGSIARSLGVEIIDRHRAGGDAAATAKIFDQLLRYDRDNYIVRLLKRNSGETILPPHLPREEFEALPAKPGVYYFLNGRSEVIYVGKANNIRKRIAGHFTGDAREWNRANVRNEVHHIRYELTGNEFVALLLESLEIRRLWPKYNLAQKYRVEEWGIYSYEDRNGYKRFFVNAVARGSRPLIRFSTKGDAWNFLWRKMRDYQLCPKLSGLQTSRNPCFSLTTGECRGACAGKESISDYNERVIEAINAFTADNANAAIFGRGRKIGEQSLVLVERGSFVGYGFIRRKSSVKDFDELRKQITERAQTPTVQNLINSYLLNPRGLKVVYYEGAG